MRIAFYAPLKPPTHATPSGDRKVAALLMEALGRAGQRVELVSTFRSFDGDGDAARQSALKSQGETLAQRLASQWHDAPRGERPDLWFTYHLYYKAPDWLGPAVSTALGIPYVVAEPSFAPKRAGGPWSLGHEAAEAGIRRADLVICPTHDDVACVERLTTKDKIMFLPPFLDVEPYRSAAQKRDQHRARLAAERGLDPAAPWIMVAAMMRPGDKLASYRELARALGEIKDLVWRLVVAGDGPARAEVEAELEAAVPGRACFLGTLAQRRLAEVFAACDLKVWPAVNEAYGMALLEAQAAGLPVASCALRGVPDVVMDGRTGLLAPPGDPAALARHVRALLLDEERRRALGANAAQFVYAERGLDAAARRLGNALAPLGAG
ncbi:MAG TPA: glycosyltransferase family 4 protein [Burkholderiales bacterium]